jgi:hypothetical protein
VSRVATKSVAHALDKAMGNTLVLVVGVGVSVYLYKRYKAAAIDAVVDVSKAPSRATLSAIDTLTRSYDKAASGYEHRIGSQAWFRNLGSTPPANTGSWQPLPPEQIIVPTHSDVPTLDSVWVANRPLPYASPHEQGIANGDLPFYDYKRWFGD